MVIKLSKALLTIYTTLRLGSLARTKLPTTPQVSVRGRNTTIEYELTMRLRLRHIAVRKTPPLFLVFPSHHQDLRSPPFYQARSLSPGLTTLTTKPVSRSSGKGLRERIPILQQREPMQQLTAIRVLWMVLCITTGFVPPTPLETLPI